MSHREEHIEITTIVYVRPEHIYGHVISENAYTTTVRYQKNGIEYTEAFENDDIVVRDAFVLRYVVEDGS